MVTRRRTATIAAVTGLALTVAGILNISWPAQQAPARAHSQAEARSMVIESGVPY